MKLLTKAIEQKLRDNSALNEVHFHATEGGTLPLKPVVKMFNPQGGATWLFTELDEDGMLFGLCDLGMGCPELGYQSLDELAAFRGNLLGLGIERDRHFTADKTLAEYADEARQNQRIVA